MPATEPTQARSPHRFVLVPRHSWAMSAAIAATAAASHAQGAYPERPIRLVVSQAPGGSSDTIERLAIATQPGEKPSGPTS